jgi:hypothetical protein
MFSQIQLILAAVLSVVSLILPFGDESDLARRKELGSLDDLFCGSTDRAPAVL